jgi:phenylacetate-CoA ligase
LDALMMRRLFIPAFEISPSNVRTFVEKIAKFQPVLVDGYAESFNFLASYVRAGGTPGFSPRAIMSSAQALPSNTRELIEAGLNTKVFDKYGSREFSGIAYECEAHSGHHVVDECYVV